MRKTFQYKLYRSKRNKHLHSQIDLAAEIYNHCIALHKRYYRLYGKHLNKYQLQKHLTKLKDVPKYQHWKNLGSQVIQDITDRVDRGYQLFFKFLKTERKIAPPSFRKRRKYKSFTLKQVGYKLLGENKIQIGKKVFKFHKSREIVGVIKTLTVKRDPLGDIYLYFSCEVPDTQTEQTMTGESAGFDFGLKRFLTSSDGIEIGAPLFFKQGLKDIQKANKDLPRKTKGSNNRKRARLNLARVHKRIANRRKDYQFKLAKKLAEQYDYLFFENLNMKVMQKLWEGRSLTSPFIIS